MTSNRPKKAFNLNVNTSDGQFKGSSPFNRFGARQTANNYLPQPYQHFANQPHTSNQPHNQPHTSNQPNYAYKPNSVSLVPSEVSSIHHSHLTNNCSNKNKKSAKNGSHHSAPNSLLATPSSSMPATPCESRRPSGHPSGSIKKSESESFHPGVKFFRSRQSQTNSASALPRAVPRAPALSANKKPMNLNNKAFKFEEYMPLCKVQNMLSKGQVVEGVLRINQRNFEDAYISAPTEGEIDIRIYGKKNINRAFNNDVVAVQIRPVNDWNIMYGVIESNWQSWKDEILDIFEAKQTSLENRLSEMCLEGETIHFDSRAEMSTGQYSGGQYSGGQYSGGQFSGGQYSGGQFSGGQYSAAQYSGGQYSAGQYSAELSTSHLSTGQFSGQLIDEALNDLSDNEELNNESSDPYESAQEELDTTIADATTADGTSLDERIFLQEEFFPDDPGAIDLGATMESKSAEAEGRATSVVVDRTTYTIDGFNLRELKPEDLIRCSFSKRCLQQTGRVVHILKSSSNKTCGGRLRPQSGSSAFVVFETTDKRIPNFLVPVSECPSDFAFNPHFYHNSLFLGEIRKWPVTSKYPFGRLVKMIGSAGEIEAETELLLVENNVDISEFPANIEEGLPITPGAEVYDIPAKEIKKRRDMRDQCVFTIDPATARDLDDALSIRKISKHSVPGKEMYEVGVHIADVSYFVKEKMPIDEMAKQRTTSIYCVQKVIPMLPRILCEKYCSLNPAEDKLTFSVFWHMNERGEIVKEWFERTVIRSAIKLSYDNAADMIAKPDLDWNANCDSLPALHNPTFDYNDIARSVNLLAGIATSLRTKRFKHGSLEITKPEIRFVLDESRYNVLAFTTDKPKSTFLVEEFMLLANISVAKQIYSKFPNKAFLRRHPLPERKMLNDFEELCRNSSLEMDTSSSKALQSSLNDIKSRVDQDSYNFLSLKLLKTMRPAEYFSTMKVNNYAAFAHYALCVPIYTHFTSPIRRYPDVIVHRLLAASLGLEKEPKFRAADMDELVTRCNDMKLANRIVGETSQKLFLSLYILSVGSLVQSAIVMTVFDQAFDCFLTKLNVTIRVYVNQLELDSCEYNHLHDQLKLYFHNRKNYVLIRVLSKVNLRLTVPDRAFLLKWHAVLV